MNNVLLIWTACNPSTIEKNHLILNGLEKNGIKTYALGFCHDTPTIDHFDKTHSADALYSYEYGSDGVLNKGANIPSKLFNNLLIMLRYSIKLYRCCKKQRFSTIIIPPQPFELTFSTILIGKLLRIKIVPNIMEYYPALPNFYNRKNLLKRLSWKIISKYSDAFIVISKFLKEIFASTNKEVFMLPAILGESNLKNGNINITHKQKMTFDDSRPILIYTSSQAYDDLLQFCLEALSKINNKNFTLIITGNYPENVKETWLKVSKNYGLDEKIIFCGFLSSNELDRLQLDSTALLIPLLNNKRHRARFPQKVLGYMALGKPIITTFIGELAEYFVDGETAIMDMSITTNGYAEKIALLLDNPDITNNIGRNGSMVVKDTFSDTFWGMKMKEFISKI